jgi:WD40 repeat protein
VKKQKKTILFLSALFLLLASIPLFSQSELALSHKGLITSIIESNGFFYTGAVDGFLIRWDANLNQERLQVSDVEIQKVAVHPDGNIIAIYETDGFSVYRLSVWDWQKKRAHIRKTFARENHFSFFFSKRFLYTHRKRKL